MSANAQSPDTLTPKLSCEIKENERLLKDICQQCSDIIFREMTLDRQIRILLIYVDGMVDHGLFVTNVLKPLMYEGLPQGLGAIDSITTLFEQKLFAVLQIKKLENLNEIVEHILKGSIAILVDGEDTVCLADLKKVESRSIEEPVGEPSLRGPRDSLTENLRTNTTLIRRRITTPKLKMESMMIGTETKTEIVVSYIEDIVNPSVIEEVHHRLSQIRIDRILESGYIEELIEDSHWSLFPQVLDSERPDVIAANLLKGRVVILTDGTPFALIVPMTFWSGLKAPDDYYERFLFVLMTRMCRFLFAGFGVVAASLYVALTNFHQEMVPTKLMISIASLRENAPFPTVIEVLMMEIIFEGLREAGIRLPRTIGPLVSILGALVIGEAAVRAGIVSAPIVIVVSAAGIASFIIPRYRFGFPLRILRFPLILLSGMFGLFGLAAGMIAILIHLTRLSPFGTPYLTPIAPLITKQLKDWWVRWPRNRTKRLKSE